MNPQNSTSQLRMMYQLLANSPGNPPVMPYNLTFLTPYGQQFVAFIISDMVEEIQKYAHCTTPRTFAFNILAANGFQNEDFRNLAQQVITLAEMRFIQHGGNFESVAVNACTDFVRGFMGYLWVTRGNTAGVVLSPQDQANVQEQCRIYNVLCQNLTQMVNDYRARQQQPMVQQQLQSMVTPTNQPFGQPVYPQGVMTPMANPYAPAPYAQAQQPSVLGGSYANAVLTPPDNPFHAAAQQRLAQQQTQQVNQQGTPFLNNTPFNQMPTQPMPYGVNTQMAQPIQESIPAWQKAAMVQMGQPTQVQQPMQYQPGITSLSGAPVAPANQTINSQVPMVRPGSKPTASQYNLTRYSDTDAPVVEPPQTHMPMPKPTQSVNAAALPYQPMTFDQVETRGDLLAYQAQEREKMRLAKLVARDQGVEAVDSYVPDIHVVRTTVDPVTQKVTASSTPVTAIQAGPIQAPQGNISPITGMPLDAKHEPLPPVESLPYVSTSCVGQKDENGKFKSILSWHQDRLKLAAEAQGKTLGELAPRFIEAERIKEQMMQQCQNDIQDVSGQGYYESCINADEIMPEGDENPVAEKPVAKYNDWSNWYPDPKLPEFAKVRLLRLKDEQPEIDYSDLNIHKDVGNVRPKWWDDRVNGIWTNVPYCRMNCDLVPNENGVYEQVLSYNLDYIQQEYFDAMENGKMIEAQHMQPWTIGRPVRSEKEQKEQDALANVIMVLADDENDAASIREMNKEVEDTFGNPEYHTTILLDDDLASIVETVENYDAQAEKKKVVNVHNFNRWRSFSTSDDMSSYMRTFYESDTFEEAVQWFIDHEGVLPSRLRHYLFMALTDMVNTTLTDMLDLKVTIDGVNEDWFDLIEHLYTKKGSRWTEDVFVKVMNERLKGFLHIPNRTVVSTWFEDDSLEDETDKDYFMNHAFTESRICLPDYGYIIRMSVDSSLFDFEESTDSYIRIQRGVTGADPISRVLYELYKHIDYKGANKVIVGFKDGRAFQCYRNHYNPQNFKLREIELS